MPQKEKWFDSTYIKIDTIKITVDGKTIDSTKYYKSVVKISRSPKWNKVRNGLLYMLIAAALFYLTIKK